MMVQVFDSPIRVYADTSVFGAVFDPEPFGSPSAAFFELIESGRYRLVVSSVLEEEIDAAPVEVRDFYRRITSGADAVLNERNALLLRQEYLKAGIVTAKWRNDALHVAFASVGGCDLIVSWNFRHIVHFSKIRKYNSVNLQMGYGPIAIHNPSEVVKYG